MDFKKHIHINGIKHSSRNKITLQLHVDGNSPTTWRNVSNNAEMKSNIQTMCCLWHTHDNLKFRIVVTFVNEEGGAIRKERRYM